MFLLLRQCQLYLKITRHHMMQPITTMEQEILWIQAVNNIKVSKDDNFAKCV